MAFKRHSVQPTALCDLEDIPPSLRGYLLIHKMGTITTSPGLYESC